MGQDEASAHSHRTAPIKINKPKGEGPDMQQAKTDDHDKSTHAWSWLGNRSPLMGEMEEAEWVLERLSLTLERALKKQSESQNKGTSVEQPPVNAIGKVEKEKGYSNQAEQDSNT